MYADLFLMNVFLQKFHGQLHFLFHRHLDYQLILHVLKIHVYVHGYNLLLHCHLVYFTHI